MNTYNDFFGILGNPLTLPLLVFQGVTIFIDNKIIKIAIVQLHIILFKNFKKQTQIKIFNIQ